MQLKGCQHFILSSLLAIGLSACDGDDDPTQATIVDAGDSFTIMEGESKQLHANIIKDKRKTIATTTWTQISGPAVTIDQKNSVDPTIYVPDLDNDTTVVLRFEAIDQKGNKTYDDLQFTITNDPDPVRPIAQPVYHSFVREGERAELRGTGSVASGENPVNAVHWTQLSGPQVTLNGADSETLTFIAPEVIENAELAFDFVVDNGVTSVPLRFTVTVTNIPRAPSANAGDDIVRQEGANVTLTGSGFVAANEPAITGYTWTQISGPSVELGDTHSAELTFTAPEVSKETQLVFNLIASNGLNSPADTVTVTVTNKLPLAEAGDTIEVLEGEAFTLDGSNSNKNGSLALNSYTWRSLSPAFTVANADTSSPTRSLTAMGVDADTEFQFGLVVSNGQDTSNEDTVTVRVKNGGDVPTAMADDIETPQNSAATLDASASTDPKNRALTYEWSQQLSENDVPVNFVQEGATIKFTAPKVTEDTQLTFSVIASNGINKSAPHVVTVKVTAAETYNGSVVKLQGNPFTTLYDSLDVNYHLYDVEVVGDRAYATYHERKKNADGIQPTGLLVIDLSDEKHLSVLKNFPIQWEDGEGGIAIQMKVAVDAARNYAYIAEPGLRNNADEDANALGLIRIDLNSEPNDDNGDMYLLGTEPSIEGLASDVVIRNGKLYVSLYNDRSLIQIDTTSAPSAPTLTTLWAPEASTSSNIVQGLDVSEDGTVAVLFDNKNVQVIRFGEITEAYLAPITAADTSYEGTRYVAIDDTGDYAYVSFTADIEDDALHAFSAVEKVDIRNIETPDAPVYFQTDEDARGLTVVGSTIYVAGGDQGLQLLRNAEDNTALALHTYYQTPAQALEVATNIAANRAYVVGDTTFSIIDLNSQAAPAQATNWVQGYLDSAAMDMPAVAHDVEIVDVPDQGEFAVVAQGADPEGNNNLLIFNLKDETLTGKAVDISNYHSNDAIADGTIALTQHNGEVYVMFPFSKDDGALRLPNNQLPLANPVPETFAEDGKVRAIAFGSDNGGFIDYTSGWDFGLSTWTLDGASGTAVINTDDRIWNDNYYDLFLSENQQRLIGIGMAANAGESWGCSVEDAKGSGSTTSTLVFAVPENTKTYTGAYDAERKICFAGYGHEQLLDIDDIQAYQDGFGLLSVAFNVTPESIDIDPESHSEKWEGELEKNNLARVTNYSLPDNPEDIYRMGNRLYIADGTVGGIQIVDTSDPVNPVLVGVLHTQDRALGVAVNESETMAIVADDNMRGVVRIPIDYPTLDRTDNDAQTATLETLEEKQFTDTHAEAGSILTYTINWENPRYDQIVCYTSGDSQAFGNETCTVTPVEGDPTAATLTWTLPSTPTDQEMRVAVGNNIEFLSISTQVIVTEAASAQ